MHAALVGNESVCELLTDHAHFDPASRDHQGNAPMHYAAMSGDLPTTGNMAAALETHASSLVIVGPNLAV